MAEITSNEGDGIWELSDEALGLGPLEQLLADDSVSEIMVVDRATIYVEKGGRLTLTGARDPYGPHAPRLNDWLSRQGADLDARVVQAGHDLTADDLAAAADWMTGADHG